VETQEGKIEQDDIALVTFWSQTKPNAPFPKLPGNDEWEVN